MKRFMSLTLVLLLMIVAVTGMAEQNRDLTPTDYSNAENWYMIPEITKASSIQQYTLTQRRMRRIMRRLAIP